MEERPTVLISSLVRNRAWILPRYLEHLYNLDYDKKLITIYWLVNNSTDKSLKILTEFKNAHINEYKDIIIDKIKMSDAPEYTRSISKSIAFAKLHWQKIYSNLSMLRNKVIDKAIDLNLDYLYNIDSDILVNKDDLNILINDCEENNISIMASIINNDQIRFYGRDIHECACNILRFDEYNKVKHITGWTNADHIIPVDATGACCIFKTDIFKQNLDMRYEFHIQGEDVGFFLNVKKAGIKAYANTFSQPSHIMSGDIFTVCSNCLRGCKKFRIMDGEKKPEIISCNNYIKKD